MSRRPGWDEVLEAAKARLGTTRAREFAEALARHEHGGAASPEEVNRAYRWFRGGKTTNVDTMLLLIDVAGWLAVSSEAEEEAADELAARRLATPLDEVATQLREQSVVLETLATVAGRLDEQTAALQELLLDRRLAQ